MPDEPNKRMDELLKSYAAKRRADAGAPLEMHPATRKMLQDEVSKLGEQTDESESWAELFERYRPFVVFAGAFAVLALIGMTWIAIRSSTPMQMAKQEEQADTARPAGRTAPARMVQAAPAEPKDFPLLADANAPSREHADKKALGLGVDGEMIAVAPASPQAMTANHFFATDTAGEMKTWDEASSIAGAGETLVKEIDKLEAPKLQMSKSAEIPAVSASKPVAAPTPPPQIVIAKSTSESQPTPQYRYARQAPLFDSSGSQRFHRLAVRRDAGGGKDASEQQVLNSFSWNQSGSQVSVLDEDGSTYEGTVLVASEERARDLDDRKRAYLETEQIASQAGATARGTAQQGQAVTFRVTGTNRTLRQVVVFEGNLVAETNIVAWTKEDASVAAKQGAVGGQMTLQNSRIEGRARIGASQEIEINAVPATR